MKSEQEMVKEFHERNGFIVGESLKDSNHTGATVKVNLDYLTSKLHVQLDSIKDHALKFQAHGDERLYRSWLMLEELVESIEAMAENDEEKLADGLGDLAYVVKGTAVTYDIPMTEVFEEIHKANMAKKKRDPKTNPRMRDKGLGWKKPDIAGAIKKGRGRQPKEMIFCKVHNTILDKNDFCMCTHGVKGKDNKCEAEKPKSFKIEERG